MTETTDERIPADTAITEEGLVVEYNHLHDVHTVGGRVLHFDPSIDGVKVGAFANYPLTAHITIEGYSYEIGCDWGSDERVGSIFNTTANPLAPNAVIRLVIPAEHPVVPWLYLGERLEDVPEEDPPATPEVPKGNPEDFEAEFFGKP